MWNDRTYDVTAAVPFLGTKNQRQPFEEQYIERVAEKTAVEEANNRLKQLRKVATEKKSENVKNSRDEEELPLDEQEPQSPPKKRRKSRPKRVPTPKTPADPMDLFHVQYSLRNRAHIDKCLEYIGSRPRSERTGHSLNNLIRRRMKSLARTEGWIGGRLRRELQRHEPILAAKLERAIREMLKMHEDLDFITINTWMVALIARLVHRLPAFREFVEARLQAASV